MNPLGFGPPPDVMDPAPVLAALRMRGALSLGSSVVLNALHMTIEKWRRRTPRSAVRHLNDASVCSVCSRSFAYACQQPITNTRSKTAASCGVGMRPSSTGSAHCWDVNPLCLAVVKCAFRIPGEGLQSCVLPASSFVMRCLQTDGWCPFRKG